MKLYKWNWPVAVLLMVTGVMLFQNCSQVVLPNELDDDAVRVLRIGDVKQLRLKSSSGFVASDYGFEMEFLVDLENKHLTSNVSQGPLATGLPASQSRALTDNEVEDIQNLILQVSIKNCAVGELNVADGRRYFEFYTKTLYTPELYVWDSSCSTTAYIYPLYRQGYAGTKELMNYILAL